MTIKVLTASELRERGIETLGTSVFAEFSCDRDHCIPEERAVIEAAISLARTDRAKFQDEVGRKVWEVYNAAWLLIKARINNTSEPFLTTKEPE